MTYEEAKRKRESAYENRCLTAIQDLFEHFRLYDQPFVISDNVMHSYQWHNPFKGETMRGEIDRWLAFAKSVYGIDCKYDPMEGGYYVFTKTISVNK